MKKNENSKEIKKEKSKNNSKVKLIVIISIIVGVALLVGLSLLISPKGSSGIFKEKVKIVKNESSKVTYDKFDNGLVSFDYPKGWKVEIAPADYIHYNFQVYNPDNPNYKFFFGLKFEGYMKSQKARDWQKKYYPSTMFAKLPALDPQNAESFYKNWNEAVDYSNKEEVKYEYFTHINDFTVIETLGQNEIGGDILRATFTNDEGELNQGLFTATVMSAGTYMVSENIWNVFGAQVDVWPLMVYNIVYMSAPDTEFVNWQPILDKCLATISFSQKFLDGFNSEENAVLASVQANQKVYDEMSDMIMDSWEKRNNSYDIISQKQSDATLGYERVYDTDTGEVYKAYNGFTDDYDGNRYQPITDDMYNLPTSGYIEK